MVRTITLVSSPPQLWRSLCEWITVCVILLVTVAVSHVWFGGSPFVDAFGVLITILAMRVIADCNAGKDVEITTAELRDYVNAGCPVDAKSWVEAHRIYGSRLQ